jgi:uncharacterized small protein (DUF1192 family)
VPESEREIVLLKNEIAQLKAENKRLANLESRLVDEVFSELD